MNYTNRIMSINYYSVVLFNKLYCAKIIFDGIQNKIEQENPSILK